MSQKTQKIVKGDCVEGMKQIKDESVDIVICDPPYNIGKDFGNNSDKHRQFDGKNVVFVFENDFIVFLLGRIILEIENCFCLQIKF